MHLLHQGNRNGSATGEHLLERREIRVVKVEALQDSQQHSRSTQKECAAFAAHDLQGFHRIEGDQRMECTTGSERSQNTPDTGTDMKKRQWRTIPIRLSQRPTLCHEPSIIEQTT